MENIHTGNKIDFKEAFGYAWGVIKKEWGFLLLLSFVTFMISLPFGILDSVWQGQTQPNLANRDFTRFDGRVQPTHFNK